MFSWRAQDYHTINTNGKLFQAFSSLQNSDQIFNMLFNTSHDQSLPPANLTGLPSCTTTVTFFSKFLPGVKVSPYCFSAKNQLPLQLWLICEITVQSPPPQGSVWITVFLAFIMCSESLVYSNLPNQSTLWYWWGWGACILCAHQSPRAWSGAYPVVHTQWILAEWMNEWRNEQLQCTGDSGIVRVHGIPITAVVIFKNTVLL